MCYFTEQIRSKLDNGGVVGAVFLDLQKSYDTLNHNILLSKLSFFNFSEDTIKWIESYLTSRKQCTRIKTHISSLRDCSTGVPQGSTLGPLLFSLYLNDFPDVCPDVHIQMYADDTVIYVHDKTKEQVAHKLSIAMTKILDWFTQCCLTLNVQKSACMYFNIKKKEEVQKVKW